MPSRAYTSFLLGVHFLSGCLIRYGVNALSVLYLISTGTHRQHALYWPDCVNALSGLYLISTLTKRLIERPIVHTCQCPLGLIPHFYSTPSKTQVLCGFQSLFLQVFVRIF